ncbi:MAG: RagB/SusD family nutrient uptake outer membrane protein [Ferruginibacter sp.]|nr:RagB/SusD family nutrient uptake outer membrane protein [Ferruginibacter sp.]
MLLVITIGSCKKYLDRSPLDASASSTFLSNQDEMDQSLNGVYAASLWTFPNNTPLLFAIEASTDIGIRRDQNAEDFIALGEGAFFVNNQIVNLSWSQGYRLIQRANQHLGGMENGKNNVSTQYYGRNRAEILVLRAWAYFHLLYMFGDLPYYKTTPTVDQVLNTTRTPVATIVADLYKDLDEAVAGFDAASAQPILGNGRVNKAVALGLKAKLALLIKDYATAVAATNTVISSLNYSLNPNYQNLFSIAGQVANNGREILFNQTYPTDVSAPENWMVWITVPRVITSSQSSHFPSQALVDKFEGKDGLRIDASTVYNPLNPRLNRDNRLKWTVWMNGDTLLYNVQASANGAYIQPKEKTIFDLYSPNRRRFNWTTGVFDNVAGGNTDWIGNTGGGIQWQVGAAGSRGGVGYVWRKYVDSTQIHQLTKTGYILMRYADILLMYAEAKIELDQIDASVVNAINLVRARAGQPAITAGPQTQMRQIVRRERVVEFAGEGLRLFDLKRWDIYAKANSGPVVGAAFDPAVAPATPVFDINDIPDYSASINQRIRFRNQVRNNNAAKFKLWPIPQFETDVNPNGIKQNPLW